MEGKPFFRCNSGLIVNLAKVQSVKNNEILVHGETLTVSRSRKKEFMEQLTEYMGEENMFEAALPGIPRLITALSQWLGITVMILLLEKGSPK